jgi:hypothetical protein
VAWINFFTAHHMDGVIGFGNSVLFPGEREGQSCLSILELVAGVSL